MARDGKPTRDKILNESTALVLENGFAGTSIDQILEKTGITKGAFFYHFKTKNALAKALIEKFAKDDLTHLDVFLKETEELDGDALVKLMHFTQSYIDMMAELTDPYPGCLYASYTNEPSHFDEDVKAHISEAILKWRDELVKLLNAVLEEYDFAIDEVDVPSLADHFTVIFEGAFIVSRALNQADVTAKQLVHWRNYLNLLFVPKK